MTPIANSLWRLQGELFEMLEAREEALLNITTTIGIVRYEPGVTEEAISQTEEVLAAHAELAAHESGIQAYVRNALVNVDDLREPLMAMAEGVTLCKARAAAETNRAILLQNRFDRLKDVIKQAMQVLEESGYWKPKQPKKLESALGSFSLRGNGGAQPVEVYDEALVPGEYCVYEGRVPAFVWLPLIELVNEYGSKELIRDFYGLRMRREVSKSAIAEALAQPCEHCTEDPGTCATCGGDASDPATNGADGGGSPCPSCGRSGDCTTCGGSGRRGVPGARLAERGVSLVVK